MYCMIPPLGDSGEPHTPCRWTPLVLLPPAKLRPGYMEAAASCCLNQLLAWGPEYFPPLRVPCLLQEKKEQKARQRAEHERRHAEETADWAESVADAKRQVGPAQQCF